MSGHIGLGFPGKSPRARESPCLRFRDDYNLRTIGAPLFIMRSSPSSGARNPPAHPPRERSKKHGTLASWRTDQNLKLVGVTRRPGVTLRALPVVGQVIVKTRRRTGFLDTVAHLQALQGKAATYRFQLFRRHYEVRVAARRDRR